MDKNIPGLCVSSLGRGDGVVVGHWVVVNGVGDTVLLRPGVIDPVPVPYA
jgi:hypothetical protein